MSAKHDGIDLNADVGLGYRENEGDAHVTGKSVAETLTGPCRGRSPVQESDVEKAMVFDAAKVICDLSVGGSDVNLNSEGVDEVTGVLDKVVETEKESEHFDREGSNCKCGDDVSMFDKNDVETGNEQLDRGFDVKIEVTNGRGGEGVSKTDENEDEKVNEQLGSGVDAKAHENNGKCDEDVSTHDDGEELEKGNEPLYGYADAKAKENDGKWGEDVTKHGENDVADTSVALRPSSEADMDRDINAGLMGQELEKNTHGTSRSLHQKFEEGTSDELGNNAIEVDAKPESDILGRKTNDIDNVLSLHQKIEEATSDGLKNQATEDDTPKQLECRKDIFLDLLQDSDVFNESQAVNLVIDSDPYKAKDINAYSEVSAKSFTAKSNFSEGDLVWGKVRSHPWWPGQVFNVSSASQKAKKYWKKNSYLIAYFGDQTFAFNEASKVKPFQEHFAFMEKQTSLEDFHSAIDCALEEVARRVEIGLSCSCIPEDAYAKIKSQIIVNAGIRNESCTRDGGGSSYDAASFEPRKLNEHMKALARLPFNFQVDRLEFAILKAQVSAFYHWKGYLQLPEFNMLGELLDSDAEIPFSGVKDEAELAQCSSPDFNGDKKVASITGKSKSQDGSSHKRKRSSANSGHPSKKEKSLSDLLAESRANLLNGKRGTDGKGDELISLSSGRKRKSVDSISDDRVVKHHEKLDSVSDYLSGKHKKSDMLVDKPEKGDFSEGAAQKCPIKKCFSIGKSILKVASQLSGSSPILKSRDGASQNSLIKSTIKEKSLFRKSPSQKHFPSEKTSPAELLSHLCLAATKPMERHNLLVPLVNFFSDFRSSVSFGQSLDLSGDRTSKRWENSEITETSDSEAMKETYWTDRIIQDPRQEQQVVEDKNEAGVVLHETPSKQDAYLVEPASAVQLSAPLVSELQTAAENFEQEAVKPVDLLDGTCGEDPSPTALILNFTNLDSVPSKENLNEIFGRFGPLHESETEVKKSKRAKVVFKRRTDAESAFSSTGKYSVFGPSLVSYCLKYMPSTPSKISSSTSQQEKKTAISEVGDSI